MPKEVVNADEFQDFWVPPPPPETTGQKIKRKIRENPFVPLGMLATVGALSYGIYGFQKGNQRIQQTMMRARVLAQGATVLVLVGGIALASMRNEEKK